MQDINNKGRLSGVLGISFRQGINFSRLYHLIIDRKIHKSDGMSRCLKLHINMYSVNLKFFYAPEVSGNISPFG